MAGREVRRHRLLKIKNQLPFSVPTFTVKMHSGQTAVCPELLDLR